MREQASELFVILIYELIYIYKGTSFESTLQTISSIVLKR